MLKHTFFIVILFLGFQFQAQAARLTAFGHVAHKNDIGVFDFHVSELSNVNIWEKSRDDFRVSLFDDTGLIASNDDNRRNWFYDVYSDGTFSGRHHKGQNWLDASLLAKSLLGDYTAVISYWTNAGEIGDSLDDAFNLSIGSTKNRYVGNYKLFIKGKYVEEGHQVSAVPAPPALWLMVSALPGIYYASKRKKNLSNICMAA